MNKQIKRRRLPSILRWIFWVVLVQLALFNTSTALYAWKFSHFYPEVSAPQSQTEENVFSKTWRLFGGTRIAKSTIDGYPAYDYDSVILQTKRGLELEGWYAKPDSNSKGTVILFHGVTISKSAVLSEASEFRYLGYNVFLVDFRGHGNSDGFTTTLGVRESEDVKLAFDYIRSKGEANIILWGSSMGAVAIAKSVSDGGIKPSSVILEMPFASLKSHLRARARFSGFSGFPEKPFAFFVTLWMGLESGYNGFKHRTTTYLKEMTCPVLLQWGALDAAVLENENQQVYQSIGSKNKNLVIYPTAAHESLISKDPLKWRIEVSRFLAAN